MKSRFAAVDEKSGEGQMKTSYFYDVTKWKGGDPFDDIGAVINDIIRDIKKKQSKRNKNDGGKPGAAIFIPSGDYHLRTQIVIDISFLKIFGTGHGFESSSIRFNVPEAELPTLHELWPGGSRIIHDIPVSGGDTEERGAAFIIRREGEPRISSVEFQNFCIDGLHFADAASGDPENSYINGKTGIYAASANDSFKISEMGIVYCEHGVIMYDSDALSVHDNFIAECGSCIELRRSGQASKITDNLIGAGYNGYSIYAENFGGLLVTANNVFPRGRSSLHFSSVQRSSVSSNRFHSFYPGMLRLEDGSSENLVSSNHFLRDNEPWEPMKPYDNKEDDLLGLIVINGDNNSFIANHISENIQIDKLRPDEKVKPVILHITGGRGNYVAANHMVVTTKDEKNQDTEKNEEDSCFFAQVNALLLKTKPIAAVLIRIDDASCGNVVLDSARKAEADIDLSKNTFRAIPE